MINSNQLHAVIKESNDCTNEHVALLNIITIRSAFNVPGDAPKKSYSTYPVAATILLKTG
jgi:hypothetical protein